MAFDGMPPLEGGAKGLCLRCRVLKPKSAFGPPRRKNKARDHNCLECRAEMAAAPARVGRPIGVSRQANVCTGCACYVAERRFGEWICAPCKSRKNYDWKVRAGRASPKPERITPLDIPDAKWRALEEKNARDAWRYWLEVKAPRSWLIAHYSRHPWRLATDKADEFRIRYRSDPEFRLKQLLRNYERKAERGRYGEALRIALKAGQTRASALEACGYTVEQLRRHLERQFKRGMNWSRFASGDIHIDHIVPLASFDLKDSAEFRAAWSLSNLRPLWAKDNRHKAAKRTHLL